MRDDGAGLTGEHRGLEPSFLGQARPSHCVDAAEHAAEPSSTDPAVDLVF
jgi:hypothetical protein